MSVDPVNLELLRMAREIVMNEYTDRRAQDHNKWLVESDYLWRTQRLRLAYPSFPPHPNELDIIERAKVLGAFVNAAELLVSTASSSIAEDMAEDYTGNTVVDTVAVVDAVASKGIDAVKEVKEDNQRANNVTTDTPESISQAELDYIKSKVMSDIDDSVPSSRRLLPALIKKIENLKNTLTK